jgi:flagellar hook-associated protein 3 FlgL
MRISTASIYQDAVINFNNMQSAIADSTNEVSSGVSLTSPAVNPTAAAQVLIATQSNDVNTQFATNRNNANDSLNAQDGILTGVTNILQSLESQIVEAGNGTNNIADRKDIATQFQSAAAQLMNLANSTDENGNYLFGGTSVTTQPYTASSNGATYNGNQQVQMMQVDSAQQLNTTQVGTEIFGNIQVAPTSYFSIASANNTSTATMSSGTVVTPGAVTGDNYQVTFTSPTTYDVTDLSTGATVSTANAYASGTPITIGGMQYTITDGGGANGPAATGDQFTVEPGNQNIFQVLTTVAYALVQSTTTPGDQTNMNNAVAQANTSISASLNNLLNVRDQIGNSMQQISSLNNVGQTLGLDFTTSISNLQDANYAQVVSQLSMEQFTYKAAQEAFASTSQLSLINILR